jgi:hypothetical protein
MRLAAGGALVARKWRAVEPDNKVKILPVCMCVCIYILTKLKLHIFFNSVLEHAYQKYQINCLIRTNIFLQQIKWLITQYSEDTVSQFLLIKEMQKMFF